MRIALGQFDVIPGNPEKNLETMLAMADEAREEGANLVAFPELCVGGYLLGDNIWNSDSMCEDLMLYNEVLRKESESGMAIAYGNVFLDANINLRVGDAEIHPNEDGRTRKYNAALIFQNGKPAPRLQETKFLPPGVQPKTLLPNYNEFDDKRYFHSTIQIVQDFGIPIAQLLQPYLIEVDGKNIPVGLEICEDLWCEEYRKDRASLNPTKMLIENGAQAIINISASPWTFGKNGARDRRVQFLKKDTGEIFVPFYYVNCSGVQNNGKNIITFDGGTTVYNRCAEPVVLSKRAYMPELIISDHEKIDVLPIMNRNEKRIAEQKLEAIVRGLRALPETIGCEGYPNVVIGLSGGIDSAVNSALCVLAYGREKVHGVNMPTHYNSQETQDAARSVAEQLGIRYSVVPIQGMVEANTALLAREYPNWDSLDDTFKDYVMQNLQARIRGAGVLSAMSAVEKGIFTNNGNKDEVFLGYATLYGDWGGAVAPIADITKTEVVAIARNLPQVFGKEIVPQSVIPDDLWTLKKGFIFPTAELRKKQFDPIKFGYHCALINYLLEYKRHSTSDVMHLYLEGKLDATLDSYFNGLIDSPTEGHTYNLMRRYSLTNPRTFVQDLEWFTKTFNSMIFKRVQSPPIIVTSKTPFGYKLRESILPPYEEQRTRELKKEILSLREYAPAGFCMPALPLLQIAGSAA